MVTGQRQEITFLMLNLKPKVTRLNVITLFLSRFAEVIVLSLGSVFGIYLVEN